MNPLPGRPFETVTNFPAASMPIAAAPAATSASGMAEPTSWGSAAESRLRPRSVLAAAAALAVGVLSFGSLGLLLVVAVAVGLAVLGLPSAVVWSAAGVTAVVAMAAAGWLARAVWRYEIGDTSDIVL